MERIRGWLPGIRYISAERERERERERNDSICDSIAIAIRRLSSVDTNEQRKMFIANIYRWP